MQNVRITKLNKSKGTLFHLSPLFLIIKKRRVENIYPSFFNFPLAPFPQKLLDHYTLFHRVPIHKEMLVAHTLLV